MVILNVKVGTETEFLYNTSVDADTDSVISDIVLLYNGQLKIGRICIGKNFVKDFFIF